MNNSLYRTFLYKELLLYGFNLEHIYKAIKDCSSVKDSIEFIESLEREQQEQEKPIEKFDLGAGYLPAYRDALFACKINEVIDRVNQLSKE